MHLIDLQKNIEYYYNKKTIKDHIAKEINENSEIDKLIHITTKYIIKWAKEFDIYESKRKRLNYVLTLDIEKVVRNILINVILLDDREDWLTSLAGQSANQFPELKPQDRVKTAAEFLVHMCDCDLFEMTQKLRPIETQDGEFKVMSWVIYNRFYMSEKCRQHIQRGMYLPPMVVPPNVVRENHHSTHLTTRKDSLILGRGNYHDGDICLDVLNNLNQTELCLNLEMVKEVGEIVDSKTKQALLNSEKRKKQYYAFLKQSYVVFAILEKAGNSFWITHKVDKRGRIYTQAYHADYQGNPFRKSVVELAHKEHVTGSFL